MSSTERKHNCHFKCLIRYKNKLYENGTCVMSASNNGFFNKQTTASKIKAELIHAYFQMWSSIMKNVCGNDNEDFELCYIDLFCGEGKYEDGNESTPILIMKSIIDDPILSSHMRTVFNDKDTPVVEKLISNIEHLENYNKLKFQPIYITEYVDTYIVKLLTNPSTPSLIVIDPFGYKGISLDLIKNAVKDFGYDVILFFNINRIRGAIENPKVKSNMQELFGEYYDELKGIYSLDSIFAKETFILDVFHKALISANANFMAKFRFASKDDVMASHYLLFITKHHKGYCNIKNNLRSKSNTRIYDCFGYSVQPNVSICDFIEEMSSKHLLSQELIQEYKQKQITVGEILYFHFHRCFTEKDIKDALKYMEDNGMIIVENLKVDGKKRKKNTFPSDVIINFK